MEKVLDVVMDEAMGERVPRVDAICLGMAGVDREEDGEVVRGTVPRIVRKTPTIVVNDAPATRGTTWPPRSSSRPPTS